jgi:hypothetical protein
MAMENLVFCCGNGAVGGSWGETLISGYNRIEAGKSVVGLSGWFIFAAGNPEGNLCTKKD